MSPPAAAAAADHAAIARRLGENARRASHSLVRLTGGRRSALISAMASHLRAATADVLTANADDVAAARAADLAPAMVERLRLDAARIEKMAAAMDAVAAQPDPIGATLSAVVRPNGLRVEKRRAPLGVVLFIYESRPNVTTDGAALCLKAASSVILRGGKESMQTNIALAAVLRAAIATQADVDPDVVQIVTSPDRALVTPLLRLEGLVDLIIPRGGESLIRAVVEQATVPVLKHYTGNCHIYLDAAADRLALSDVLAVCVNAKTGYPGGGVCNAAEKLVVHAAVAHTLLPPVAAALRAAGVTLLGDNAARAIDPQLAPATDADWPTEYLALRLAIRVVASIDDAIAHINTHGSHHTDAILSADTAAIDRFVNEVDTASVVVNASTRFADGGEYGLGAELGISTDKLHARGPMGADDLCTYKWIVTGAGHVR